MWNTRPCALDGACFALLDMSPDMFGAEDRCKGALSGHQSRPEPYFPLYFSRLRNWYLKDFGGSHRTQFLFFNTFDCLDLAPLLRFTCPLYKRYAVGSRGLFQGQCDEVFSNREVYVCVSIRVPMRYAASRSFPRPVFLYARVLINAPGVGTQMTARPWALLSTREHNFPGEKKRYVRGSLD